MHRNLSWPAYEVPALHQGAALTPQGGLRAGGWQWQGHSSHQSVGPRLGPHGSQAGKHDTHKVNNMILFPFYRSWEYGKTCKKKKKERKQYFQWTFHRSWPCYQQKVKGKLSATADLTSSPLPLREPPTSLLPFLSFNLSVPLFF